MDKDKNQERRMSMGGSSADSPKFYKFLSHESSENSSRQRIPDTNRLDESNEKPQMLKFPLSNNKQFKIINTDEKTVKQNNFYFTKQQKKLQQSKPDRTISVVTLPPVATENNNTNITTNNNTSPSSSSSSPSMKLQSIQQSEFSKSPESKMIRESTTKNNSSFAPSSTQPSDSPPHRVLAKEHTNEATYHFSPIEGSAFYQKTQPVHSQQLPPKSDNVNTEGKQSPEQNFGRSRFISIDSQGNTETTQHDPHLRQLQQFPSFPPYYGNPYGMLPFPPPLPNNGSPNLSNGHQPPFMMPPPPPPPQPPSIQQHYIHLDRDESESRDTTPGAGNDKKRKKSSRGSKSRKRETFVPPMPIFPPPPPALNGSRGPELILRRKANTVLERENLIKLLEASSKLPTVDMDFYLAVGSLNHLLRLKNKESDEDEQDSENENELAFIDKKMENYYFKEENDLDTYYSQIKWKKPTPYVLTKSALEQEVVKGNDNRSWTPVYPHKEVKSKKIDFKRVDLLGNYNFLQKNFNENMDDVYHNRRKEILAKIEAVKKDEDSDFKFECHELEELRDLELLRLKNFRKFERNENLRLYYDDSLYVYQELNQNVLEKLSSLRNFLSYQKEILSNDLDKELLDISNTRGGRLTRSFGSSVTEPEPVVTVPTTDSSTLTVPSFNTVESSSDTDITSQSGSNLSAVNSPVKRQKKQVSKQKIQQQQQQQQQQYLLDEYTPLLSTSEFEFITDTTTNFYAKIMRYLENNGKSSLGPPQQQQQSSSTRSAKSLPKVPKFGTPTKKLSNLAKSIRDSTGFSGGLSNSNDHTQQLQKVMKLYTAPSRLADEDIFDDLKMMGKDTDKWMT